MGSIIGITVIATDLYVSPTVKPHTQVEQLNHLQAIEKYGNFGVLFMSWPHFKDTVASDTLRGFKGNKMIFVGESRYGCTGDDSFFCMIENGWQQVDSISIPQWPDIHDKIYLYVRK